MRVIVTGGGTGGHIYPAIAIAEAIKTDMPDSDILYIGCEDGLERDIVSKTPYVFKAIKARGLPRKLNLQFIKALMYTAVGVIQAIKLIIDFKPNLVIGTGGFVCGPAILAAKLCRIPAILHEQNAYPGLTNRLLAPIVNEVMINFEKARKVFKTKSNITLTGLPVRCDITNVKREDGAARFGLNPNKPIILITGGSRGARTINRVMALAMPILLSKYDVQIIFATGTNGYAETSLLLKEGGINPSDEPRLVLKDYLYDMSYALAAADIVIGRAGATFLAEIAMCGLPGILLPYPYASENHQVHNARAVVESKAAKMIQDHDFTVPRMLETLSPFLNDKAYYEQTAKQMKKLAKPHALEDIMRIVRQFA